MFIITLSTLLTITSLAFADEVWESTLGKVIYAEDIGPTAMWTYTYNDKPGVIYILGLAGIYDNRGAYDGYWAESISKQRCDTQRTGPGKKPTYYWGRFYISFIDKGFPTHWTAKWGYCDAAPNQKWDGKPYISD